MSCAGANALVSLPAPQTCITTADGRWIGDDVLLKQLRDAVRSGKRGGRFDATAFGADVRKWSDAFGVPGLASMLGYSSRAGSARVAGGAAPTASFDAAATPTTTSTSSRSLVADPEAMFTVSTSWSARSASRFANLL